MPTTLDPASPGNAAIVHIFVVTHLLMFAIFGGVLSVLLTAWWRFRERPGNLNARQFEGNTPLEIAWTAMPAVLLAGIFVWMLQVLNTVQARSGSPADTGAPLRVLAVGHRWWWEFRLPELGVITANELRLPVNRRVVFDLTASEIVHSFWTPQFGGKLDMVPGKVNQMTVVPTQVGEFSGVCAEFCGIQHAWMRYALTVTPAAEFPVWTEQQAAAALEPPSGLERRGHEVFFATPCQSCHTVRGTDAAGLAGPDLTHFGSRTSIGAGALANTPDNLARWLRDPQAVKPGNLMPRQPMSDDDLTALVAYLSGLK